MQFRKFAFLSVLAVVVISGCVGGSTQGTAVEFSQTEGAVINDFSFDSSQIFENDTALLTIRVQNVGAKNMTGDSQYFIYNFVSGSEPEKWGVLSGNLTQVLTTTGFLPPDVERRIPGSLDIQTVELRAPTLGLAPGMIKDDTFKIRLCYPYSTTAFSTVTTSSKNELRISNPKTSDAVTRATAGPIQMKLISGDTMVSGRDMILVFEVTNVGGGFSTKPDTPCTSQVADVPFSETDKVKVTVKVDGATACDNKEVRISNGKGTLSCKATGLTSSGPTTPHTIVATATYDYFITKEAKLTVKSNQ
ncbi:Uncharacterised protein [uncultured archaeon]|nr:Uncharacterised protein [uncultured archaeon]